MTSPTPLRGLAAGALACGLAALGCGAPPREPGDVVLVTLDTTRPDHLGCYGNRRVRTPHLDRLCREGTVFEQAFTPVPSTLPSHASIHTGTSPLRHGVHDNAVYVLEETATTLAERLREAGFATGAFVSAFVLDDQFGLAQGFDVYDDEMELPLVRIDPARAAADAEEGERRWLAQLAGPYQRRADAVTRRAVAWLEGLGERRAFLWIHYFDPHQPYDAPAPWTTAYDPDYRGEVDGDVYHFADLARRERWGALRNAPPAERAHMIARYDGEISFMDQEIGSLLGALERSGRLERALVVVVADHGEAFGEHAQIFEHNLEVFDPAVRVPLVVRRPDGVGRGARVPGLVRTLDVAPTVLEWAGLETGAAVDGVSLLPLTRDPRASAPGEVLLEARRARQVRPAPHSFLALRTGRHKLLRRLDPADRVRAEVLYDLELDPREQAPRPAAEVAEAGALATRLDALRAGRERPREALPVRPLDEITSEALKALGYIER